LFTIAEDPQFYEEVTVETPDGTGWTTQKLRTLFRVLPLDEVTALDQGDGTGRVGVEAILERAVLGFRDLVDEKGKPLDGFGDWRGKLLQLPHVRMALLRGYSAAVTRVSLGNSASSAAAGRPVN
jgi:hypothetical protein